MSHLLEGLFKLPFPRQGKPRIASLLAAILRQCDQIEKVFAHIFREQDLTAASRAGLNVLARLIGETSNANDLELFRRCLIARAISNTSDGTRATLISLTRQLFGTTAIEFQNLAPKCLQIRMSATFLPTSTTVSTADICRYFLNILQDAADPGLTIELLFFYADTTEFPGMVETNALPAMFRTGS